MKVLNIGNSELSIIEEALSHKEDVYGQLLKEETKENIKRDLEYELAHVRTIGKLIKDQRLQELCERCLSYFWDMYKEMGGFCDLLEELIDDMGIDEEELVELFHEAGFEEE